MKKQTNFIKGTTAVLLSGTLALAFSPVVFAPVAFAASGSGSSAETSGLVDVGVAKDMIQNALEENDLAKNSKEVVKLYENTIVKNGAEDDLNEEQLQYVASCEAYQRKLVKQQNKKLSKQNKKLEKELAAAQARLDVIDTASMKQTRVSKPTVKASGMGKLVVSWKVKSPADGSKYQIKYRVGSEKWTSVKTTKLKKTFAGLPGNTKCSFKIRAYKKLSSKTIYSSWSKSASAKVVGTYKAGRYTVKGDLLHARQKTSVSSPVVVDILRGTKVRVTQVKVVKGIVWGKLTYKGQTGWVQMQYLK